MLTLHRLTVRGAAVRTVGATALQAWTVAPQFGDAPAAATLRADLVRALDGSLDIAARLAKRTPPNRRGEAAPPSVRVLDGASTTATVLEVRAHDVPGLLYTVAKAFTARGVGVLSARVRHPRRGGGRRLLRRRRPVRAVVSREGAGVGGSGAGRGVLSAQPLG